MTGKDPKRSDEKPQDRELSRGEVLEKMKDWAVILGGIRAVQEMANNRDGTSSSGTGNGDGYGELEWSVGDADNDDDGSSRDEFGPDDEEASGLEGLRRTAGR